jgi:syntaxin 5
VHGRRLDSDVEISLDNIQMGEESIGRAWRRVSSNRGLILKIFGVILLFILLFVVVF